MNKDLTQGIPRKFYGLSACLCLAVLSFSSFITLPIRWRPVNLLAKKRLRQSATAIISRLFLLPLHSDATSDALSLYRSYLGQKTITR